MIRRILLLSVAACAALFARAQEPGMDCFGIIVGRGASTDGYVYLGHNEDQGGEQMLNIYNVPPAPDRLGYLWFEFPGQQAGDSFVNEWGVAIASDRCASRETKAQGSVVYEVRVAVAQQSRSLTV